MKINLHTVIDVAERDVEHAAENALAALIKSFKGDIPAEINHIETILTTDAGPRQINPTPEPEAASEESTLGK